MHYEVKGETTPVLICNLNENESMITEQGSMVWMSDNMCMQTGMGGVKKAFGRIFSGESIFQNTYTAKYGPGLIAFASSFPGSIVPIDITADRPVIVQKNAFLAAEKGVELSVYFQKKLKNGLFGGEGFIMQLLSGNGKAFIEVDGHAQSYWLDEGQSMIISTGNLVMMDATCHMDITVVKGVGNILFGGEGLFHTVVTGPGKIVLQSMTIANLASLIYPYLPDPMQNNQ